MKITELVAILRANITDYEQKISHALKITDGLGAKALEVGGKFDTMATRIGGAMTAATAGIVGATAKMGIEFLAMKQSSEIAFTTMLGSAEKAKSMMEDLVKFAAATPFELPGLVKSTQMMLAFGFEAKEVLPTLRAIGDAAAGLGGSPELIAQITRAFGQMKAKGKVQAGEMLQLAEAGVPAWQMLADVLGTDVATAMKLSEAGMIKTEDVMGGMIEGLNTRFGGLMEKQSQTFNGLLSTMMDNARQKAGFIFEPLFAASTAIMAQINAGFDGNGGTALLGSLRNSVAMISRELEMLAASNGGSALQMLGSYFEWAARMAVSFLRYLRENGPALAEAAAGWGELISTIGEFLVQHPEVVAAFLAYKGAEMFGVTDFLRSFGGLIGTLITNLAQMAAQAGLTQTAMVSLKTVGFAGAVIAIALVAKAIYDANGSIRAYRAEVEKTLALSEKLKSREQKQQGKVLSQADAMDPENKRAFLQMELEKAKKNQAGRQGQAAGAASRFNEKDTTGAWLIGDKVREVARQDMEEAKKQAEQANQWVQDIQDKLNDLGTSEPAAAKAVGAAIGQAAVETMAGGDAGGMGAGLLAGKQAIADAKKADKAAETAAKKEERDQASVDKRVESDRMQFGENMLDQGAKGGLRQTQGNAFGMEMMSLSEAYKQGTISQIEYEAGLKNLTQAVNETSRVAQERAAAVSSESLQFTDAMEQVREKFGTAAAEGVKPFEAKFDELVERLNSGSISVDQFKNATADLNNEVDRAARLKQQEALLKGDFAGAGLDFNQSLKDKFAQAQMNKFQGMVDQTFNNMTGLGNAAKNVQDGFGRLGGQMNTFGKNMSRVASPEEVGKLSSYMNSLFNTRDGQVALLFNNIQLAWQRLGILKTYEQQKKVQDEIAAMQAEMDALLTEAPPILTNSNSPEFIDPGLGGKGSKAGGGNGGRSMTISLPNLTRMGVTEVRTMTDAVIDELNRRGAYQ